jgi:hypothetical protein
MFWLVAVLHFLICDAWHLDRKTGAISIGHEAPRPTSDFGLAGQPLADGSTHQQRGHGDLARHKRGIYLPAGGFSGVADGN